MSRRIAAAWLVLLLVPVAIAAQEPGNPRDARLRRDLGEALMRLRDAELRTVSAVQGSDNDPAALERGRPEFTEHAEALAHTRALLDTVVFGTTWGASELERLRAAYPRSALLDRYAAALLLRQGHADEAAAAYAALVARTNVDAALHHEHGRALERSGSRTGALTAHERALELDPSHEAAFRALVRLHREEGTLVELLTQVQRLQLRRPDAEHLVTWEVELLHRTGRHSDAHAAAARLQRNDS